jgi:hypothetical protein
MANWDNEIDDVARQMTAGEPDAGFSARVLARIDDATRSRRGWSWWVWPAGAVAAAAIAALAIVPEWRSGGQVRPKPDTTTEVRLKPDITTAANITADVRLKPDATTQVEPERYVASRLSRTNTLPADSLVAQVSDLAPPPIEIDSIDVESMDGMDTIGVAPLAVARLEVPAIADE